MSRKRKKLVNESGLFSDKNILADLLKKATKNLYYISETDAEITPFIGRQAAVVTKEEVLRQAKKQSEEKIYERDFEEIFEKLTKIQDWFGEEETTTAEKFMVLKKLLSENLKDLKVFKIGQIELDIYFVGLDKNGNLAGVKTKAVET